jgi:hypothetical protein
MHAEFTERRENGQWAFLAVGIFGSGQWAVAIKVQEFRSMYRNASRRPRPAGFRASAVSALQRLPEFAAI